MNEREKKDREFRVRFGATLLIVFGTILVISSLAIQYNVASAGVSNAIIGGLLIILATVALRAPLEATPLCWVTGAFGLWIVAAPFVLGYNDQVMPTWLNLWLGGLSTAASAFIAGEAAALQQPLEAHD